MKPELPENYERQTWVKLREAIAAVHAECPISYSLEELYQAVENMCSHRLAAQLYENLKSECERHVRTLVPVFQRYALPPSVTVAGLRYIPISPHRPDVDDVQFLLLVNKQWTDHCRHMVSLSWLLCHPHVTVMCPSCDCHVTVM